MFKEFFHSVFIVPIVYLNQNHVPRTLFIKSGRGRQRMGNRTVFLARRQPRKSGKKTPRLLFRSAFISMSKRQFKDKTKWGVAKKFSLLEFLNIKTFRVSEVPKNKMIG